MATKLTDTAKPQPSNAVCTESSLNCLLYDPPRWGWSAVGGITDLLTPHERSRRRIAQAAFRQKIRLEKEKGMAKKTESTIPQISTIFTENTKVAQSDQTPLEASQAVGNQQPNPLESRVPEPNVPQQLQPSKLQPNSDSQSQDSQMEMESQKEEQKTEPQQPQKEANSQIQQPQLQADPQIQNPPSLQLTQAQHLGAQNDILQPIFKDANRIPSSSGVVAPLLSIRPVTPTATGINPSAPIIDSSKSHAGSNSYLEEHAALWGMSLKHSTEEDGNPSEDQDLEVEATVEAYQDGVLDMYSYHRGREGMEPRDPDSGELLAAHVPTDTNHHFDSQRLLVTVIVEFPLEDVDDLDSRNTGEDSDIAMFRETVQWDLDHPSTASPAEFANCIASEYGLSFGQMMDLATSIQEQIDAHLRQNCNYCVPVAINDPNGNERRFNPVIRQAQPYDYVVRGNGGGILVSKKRSLKHQQQVLPKPKARSSSITSATDNVSVASRNSRKEAEKVMEVEEEVEAVYCEEIQKRVLEASKQSILATQVDGKSGLLQQRKDWHCHICHKKCDLTYSFACGIINHTYCHVHCKSRLDLDIDIEKPAYYDYCPVCALSCECPACSRKLQNVAYDFKKQCTEQNEETSKAFFPNILEKCQNASATNPNRKNFKVIEVNTDAHEKATHKKSVKGSAKSADGSSKQSRQNVPKPSLLDFPREVFGAVEIDPGHPDDYMTVYSGEGAFRAYSIPEVWEKEAQRAIEIQREEKANGSLSQEIIVSSCEEIIEDGNVDYCNVCAKGGNIICCDFCPRAFHQACMGDGAVSNDDEGEEKWECPDCRKEKQGLPQDFVDGSPHHDKLSAIISGNEDLGNDKNGLQLFSIIYEMVNMLMAYDFGVIFQKPVQGEKGYRKIVKHPMDLGTIRTKIEDGGYIDANASSFEAAIIAALKDVELVWHNCFLYNALDSAVYRMAGVLRRRASGIRKVSFDHLLSAEVKSAVGEYVSLCEKERLQLLVTQRPKNLAEAKALQAKQPKGKYKMFVNSKHATTKKVAIFDPSTGRIVKAYSSVKNAAVAHSHLVKLGHECEWTDPDILKLVNRSPSDPKCLIFGYRWLPLDDLRTKKVKFRRKASASTILEMRDGDCLYRFLSIEDALSYLFLPPAIEMTEARNQLKRVPAGTDFVELFGVGWRKPAFESSNSEKDNGGGEMAPSEKLKILLADCAVLKMDSCTRRTLMAFGSENAAFEDWKRVNSASPLSTEPTVGDLDYFRKEYLEGSLHVDGIVWKRCPTTDTEVARPKSNIDPELSGKGAVPKPAEESSDTPMDMDESKQTEDEVENPDQSKEQIDDPKTALGKRKLDADEGQQAQQKKQAFDDNNSIDDESSQEEGSI